MLIPFHAYLVRSSRDEDEEENEDEDGDASMAVDDAAPAAATKPSDPDDLSAYNLDDYDEETKGAGTCSPYAHTTTLFLLLICSFCSSDP